MCGFLGLVGTSAPDGCKEAIARIAASTMGHRGPDGSGETVAPQIALACHRLALTGGLAGEQPCTVDDTVVAYNGETYAIDGVPVDMSSGVSDTALVARHLDRGGDPTAFNGMFAVAHWSRSRAELRLVRDRFGIKPLYWGRAGGGLAFGSCAHAVRRVLDGSVVPGEAAVAYLSLRGPFADQDLFAGVHPVPPGASLRWTAGAGPSTSRLWDPLDGGTRAGRRRRSVEELEDALLRAVDSTLGATAPVGVCLSGGVDSSLLVAMARRLRGPDIPVYVLSSPANRDDLEAALEVAGTVGVRPRVVDMATWPAALDRLVPRLDEPPVTESTLGVAALAAAARADGVKALISGEGADELFGGYHEYRTRRFTVADQMPEAGWLRAHLRPGLSASVDRFESRLAAKVEDHRRRGGDPGTFDLESRLARLLRRIDSAMMAHSVEGRVPYLVDDVVAAAASWSWSERTAGLGKGPLRAVARRWLPSWVSDRPKQPFASGVRHRPESVRAMLLSAREALEDVVTPTCLEACARDPAAPQSWKLAALGVYLQAHQLRVAADEVVPS